MCIHSLVFNIRAVIPLLQSFRLLWQVNRLKHLTPFKPGVEQRAGFSFLGQ